MSEIKVNSIKGVGASAAAITVNNTDGTCTANITTVNSVTMPNGGFLSNRRINVNGAMTISQRGTSFSTVSNNESTIDQFALTHDYGSSQMSVSHSTTSPDGFSNSYKLDVNTADTSIGSGQYVAIRHRVEAQNLQHLAFGTSSAKSISLSFYVRSNVTGTYAVNIQQTDNSKKQVSGTYTINSADTWERKTFTFAGDTSGVINNDTGDGFEMLWYLVAGSNRTSGTARSTFTAHATADEAAGQTANILSSTSNEFYLTGVQLEVGSVATDFEHRSYTQELALAQRYYYVVADARDSGTKHQLATGFAFHSGQVEVTIHYPVMRASASLVQGSGTDYFKAINNNNNDTFDSWLLYQPSPRVALLYASASGLTAGEAYRLEFNNDNGYIHLQAEL